MAWNFLRNPARTLGLSAARSPYRDDQAAATKDMAALRPAFQNIQNRGTGIVNTFLPQQVGAGQNLLDYYRGGPDEAGMNASNATSLQGMDNGYRAAGARIKSLGARSGADVTGAQVNLESGNIANNFRAQQMIAQRKAAEVERFKRGALTTAGQMTGQGAGFESAGLRGHEALDGHLFASYGNLAAQDEAQKAATFNRIMQFVQTGGQVAAAASGTPMPSRGVSAPSSAWSPDPNAPYQAGWN